MNAKAGWLLFATVLVYSSIGLLTLNSYQLHTDNMLALEQDRANDGLLRIEDTNYLANDSVDADAVFSATSIRVAEPMVEAQLLAANLAAESLQEQLRIEAAIEARLAMEEAAIITRQAIENSIEETIIGYESEQIAKAGISGPARLLIAKISETKSSHLELNSTQIETLRAFFAAEFVPSVATSDAAVLPRQTARIDRKIEIDDEPSAEPADFRKAGYRMRKSSRSRTALTIVPRLSVNVNATNFLSSYKIQAIASIQKLQHNVADHFRRSQLSTLINVAKTRLSENWIIESVKQILQETRQEILLDINYRPQSTEFRSEIIQVGYVLVIPDSDSEFQSVLNPTARAETAIAPRIPKFDGRFALASDSLRVPGTGSTQDPAMDLGVESADTGRKKSGRVFRLLRFRRK